MFCRRILVICEEQKLREKIIRALRPLNLSVEYTTHEKIFKITEHIKFECILPDLDVPGICGPSTIEKIRKVQPDTPIVVMANNPTIPAAVRAMRAGAADFIQKPFSPAGLRERITRVLNRKTPVTISLDDYLALMELAKEQIANHRYSDAQTTLQRAIADQPSKPEAYTLTGVLHEKQGEWGKARNFYRAAVNIAPEYVPALKRLKQINPSKKLKKYQ